MAKKIDDSKKEKRTKKSVTAQNKVRSSSLPKESSRKKQSDQQKSSKLSTDKKTNSSIILLSETEKKRRRRHEEYKKCHIPNGAELYYGQLLPVWEPGWLIIQGARHNNLKSIDVPFPLSAFTAVTGVSGSGKSSLVEDILYKSLARTLHRSQTLPGSFDHIWGIEQINKVIEVDQRPIGLTPTSNPATYTGVFDLIRQLFAQLPEAKLRGYSPRRFSFNAPGGRCEKCEGAGQIKIEMHFLADVLITCDSCNGKRYDQQTLEIKYRGRSIADILEMSCGEALKLFANIPAIARILRTLCDVGLDYITLGQPAPTLSGGEAQRVKLATELARPDTGRTLYILDEPTTGLHFEDLRKLLDVIHRLVDLGNTVIIIEHNLDIIKSVDWIVELGPEAGLEGGHLVFAGTPEQLVDYEKKRLALPLMKQKSLLKSYTAEVLIPVFENGIYQERSLFDAKAYSEELRRLQEDHFDVAAEMDVADVKMPWETDGRLWHTVNRVSRTGTACRWEGKILNDIVDKIEESNYFAETDWNNRTIVEIRADKKSLGWFFHAITGEEWLLKLKFRTAKNTFKKDILQQQLNLCPLNEIDEIPLYGTISRVKVETTGPWQEVELKVYSYEEIDRPEFWNFLDLAIERFGQFTDKAKDNSIDLTPWRSLGKEWHLTPRNCYGGSDKPKWPMKLLETIFEVVAQVSPDSLPVWTNKVIVPFYLKKDQKQRPWVQIYTKNCEFICIQLNVPKNTVPLGRLLDIGIEQEVDGSNADYDAVYLRFTTEKEFDVETMKLLFQEVLLDDQSWED
ncbi:MAG: hypothetical protein Q4C95_04800 [Planctomycetia bacterium]|nr:hypothetical protein [Planctomycetia bacterium]